jgi:hypothetical protein
MMIEFRSRTYYAAELYQPIVPWGLSLTNSLYCCQMITT